VRYVAPTELTAAQLGKVTEGLTRTLRYPFEFTFLKVDRIERARGGKFEEFVSAIAPPTPQ
jgi:hypothetical protein